MNSKIQTASKVNYYLLCFDKKTEQCIKEIQLEKITLKDLQMIFNEPNDDFEYGSYVIDRNHAEALKLFYKDPFFFEKYDYMLQCHRKKLLIKI